MLPWYKLNRRFEKKKKLCSMPALFLHGCSLPLVLLCSFNIFQWFTCWHLFFFFFLSYLRLDSSSHSCCKYATDFYEMSECCCSLQLFYLIMFNWEERHFSSHYNTKCLFMLCQNKVNRCFVLPGPLFLSCNKYVTVATCCDTIQASPPCLIYQEILSADRGTEC